MTGMESTIQRSSKIWDAMRAGTEVPRKQPMILTDDNFASIETAVEEGRTVHQNLQAISFILPVNGGESLTILVVVLLGTALPILPLQILWEYGESCCSDSAARLEPSSFYVMRSSPSTPTSRQLNAPGNSVFNLIVIFGLFEWIQQTTETRV